MTLLNTEPVMWIVDTLLVLPAVSILWQKNLRSQVRLAHWLTIETVSPEGTFCDTVQVPSGADDMQLI